MNEKILQVGVKIFEYRAVISTVFLLLVTVVASFLNKYQFYSMLANIIVICYALLELAFQMRPILAEEHKYILAHGILSVMIVELPIALINTDICVYGNLKKAMNVTVDHEPRFIIYFYYLLPLFAGIFAFTWYVSRKSSRFLLAGLVINLFYTINFACIYGSGFMGLLWLAFIVYYLKMFELPDPDFVALPNSYNIIYCANKKTFMLFAIVILMADSMETLRRIVV